MMSWLKGGGRFFLVTVGIIVLTSVSIDATDMLRGSHSALGILADRATSGCADDMVRVDGSDGSFCIDQFEASVGASCPIVEPGSADQTAQNIQVSNCIPESKENAKPWRHVVLHQAVALCARAGKRLPTNTEWYQAAVGTPDNNACQTSGKLRLSEESDCRSGVGAYDMIGNVWELVASEVSDGKVDGYALPPEGYISEVDMRGLVTMTTTTPQVIFNNDYFWADPTGDYTMMRGGFHGGGSDAGVYATYAKLDKNFSSPAIGFRCVSAI